MTKEEYTKEVRQCSYEGRLTIDQRILIDLVNEVRELKEVIREVVEKATSSR